MARADPGAAAAALLTGRVRPLRRLSRLVIVTMVAACAAFTASAGPEEELGPEKMAIADAIVEKVIYGIRYERVRGEKIRHVIRAWADYYLRQGAITQRDSMMIQVYAGRAAVLYQQGVEHIPYAERLADSPGARE